MNIKNYESYFKSNKSAGKNQGQIVVNPQAFPVQQGAVKLPKETMELWDADPNCDHDEQPAPGGGVKCSKCGGRFCI